jgi:ribose transport system substrate-binding protein
MKNIPKKPVTALVVTCTVIAGAAIGLPSNASAADKVYNIALSNSYIGNQWRVQMVNLTKAYAEKYYKDRVKLRVINSGTDVQAQIAAIDDMISQKVDAILVDPASESALNPVLEEAAKQGIVVVDFDHAVKAVVQAPLEDHVSESAAPIMRLQAVKLVGLVIEGVEVDEHDVALDAARVAHS